MNIKIRNEFIPLNLLVLALIVAIALFPSNVLRVILGLPFLLFLPGYVLASLLFPRKQGIDNIERVVLSFGLSLLVVVLLVLIADYSSWGIRLESVLYPVAFFIFAASIASWFRRKRLPEAERFSLEFSLTVPGLGGGILDRALLVTLVLVVLGTLGTLGYIAATPTVVEKFTEFYVLGLEGEAADYPEQLTVGEEGKVIIGIINREHEVMSYRIEVKINGVKNSELGEIRLEHDGKWQQELSFIPQKPGEDQKVEFVLYKGGEAAPSLEPLYLWLDVVD